MEDARFKVAEYLFRLVEEKRYRLGEYNRTAAMNDAEQLMDELNGPPLHVDSLAMTGIEEIARKLVRESRGELKVSRVIIQSLYDYMMTRGVVPNFKPEAQK